MDKLLKKFLYCICVGLLCAGVRSAPVYGQSTEIFVVEAGTNAADFGGGPTVVDVTQRLGETISFEIFINHTGPDLIPELNGYQMNFPCEAVASAGTIGAVDYVQGTGGVFTFRDDFVYFQIDSVVGVDESGCPGSEFRFVGAPGTQGAPRDINGLPVRISPKTMLMVAASASALGSSNMFAYRQELAGVP